MCGIRCAILPSCESLNAFSFPTTIVFGCGAVYRLSEELKKRKVSRPLLVTDAGFMRTGFERVSKLVPAAVFFKVDPNPTEQNVFDPFGTESSSPGSPGRALVLAARGGVHPE